MKTINSNIKLIADDGTTGKLIANIRASPLDMATGDATGLVIYHFDIKKFGEPLTKPDVRITPIRENYTRLVKAVLEARNPNAVVDSHTESYLQRGEIAIILDGGKTGNKTKLLGPWLPPKTKSSKADDAPSDDEDAVAPAGTTVPSSLMIVKEETSISQWKSKSRSSTMTIKQCESCHFLSHNKICLPECPRKHYPGTNCGDALSGVKMPPHDDVWHLS